MSNQVISAFFALARAGLWEQDINLSTFGRIEYEEILNLSEEQVLVGLITVGLEHVKGVKVPQENLLHFIGEVLQIEQLNSEMNRFIRALVEKMYKADIYALLVKGQGIAQCYEKPLWRSCGDVDFLLSGDNYQKAKALLLPMASEVEQEGKYEQHLGLTIDGWVVELHGSLRSGISTRVDKGVSKEAYIYGKAYLAYKLKNMAALPAEYEVVARDFTSAPSAKGDTSLRPLNDILLRRLDVICAPPEPMSLIWSYIKYNLRGRHNPEAEYIEKYGFDYNFTESDEQTSEEPIPEKSQHIVERRSGYKNVLYYFIGIVGGIVSYVAIKKKRR